MIKILTLVLGLFFLACHSSRIDDLQDRKADIDQLIKERKFIEANTIVEKMLVLNPANNYALEKHTFLQTKIPNKIPIKSENDLDRTKWIFEQKK
ncbi:MAG: hypothetical protein NE327_17990 [Lentisphaeraceae bacterium]|nr:hypothetical protein [Lentisphaeraceae bacterium]